MEVEGDCLTKARVCESRRVRGDAASGGWGGAGLVAGGLEGGSFAHWQLCIHLRDNLKGLLLTQGVCVGFRWMHRCWLGHPQRCRVHVDCAHVTGLAALRGVRSE